jgi:putative flippase GtrA
MPEGALTTLQRARRQMKGPEFARFFRYSMVSVVSTFFSLFLLYFFFRIAKVGSAAKANVCATAIATVPSYYLNRTWAWKRAGKSHLMREVVPFWVIAFLSLLLSTGAVDFASREAHNFHLHSRAETLLVEFANFFTYGVLWVAKFWFFNKVLFKHHAPKAEPA